MFRLLGHNIEEKLKTYARSYRLRVTTILVDGKTGLLAHYKAEKNIRPFYRHFHSHFLAVKLSYFDSSSVQIRFQVFNAHKPALIQTMPLNHGYEALVQIMASNKRQAIIWTNDGLFTDTFMRTWSGWVKTLRPTQDSRHFSDDILSAFSRMKMCEFLLRFHWCLYLRVKLTIFQHWFR